MMIYQHLHYQVLQSYINELALEEELSVVTFTAQHARTRPDGTNDAIDDAETGV